MNAKRTTAADIFSRELRRLRIERGEPQKKMAMTIGVSVATISDWESAKRFPSGKHLDDISRYTDTPIQCLFCPEAMGCRKKPERAC